MSDSDTPTTAADTPGPGPAYGAEQIRILEGLEAVRKRPGMYIGDTGTAGLHHLVWEAVDNAVDECMAGRATTVAVRIHADGSVSIADDGIGIPVERKSHDNPAYDGKPAVELVMTVLHAGGKFGEENSAYKVSGGLHGVGISCVNALSEWLEVEIHRDGKIHKIRFERGATTDPLHIVGEIPANAKRTHGTRVIFKPDSQIFPDVSFVQATLLHRLRELAYLNPGVIVQFTDERVGADGELVEETFRFDRGLVEYIEHINASRGTLHEIVHFQGENEPSGLLVEAAFQFNDGYSELMLTFANNIRTVDGGTHLSGFKTALTRTLNAYIKKAGLIKDKDPMPSGDDWREGLAAVISVKLPEPQFEGQTKGKLRNTEVEGFVSTIVGDRLTAWLEEHPSEAKKICQKGILAAQAREAARKARDLTRRKSALESGSMPHKLRDCTTKDVDRSELFIVEGDSAGGSATQGRDVETQAILPLRGKLLNVEKARLDKVLAFEEIRTLISALRCGIGPDFDASKLRYGRIIIMTDADVDGSHIRTLLLTFFFRQMPELIRRGRIYIAQPPLYQVTRNRKSRYVLNERDMDDVLISLGLDGASLVIRDVEGDVRGGDEPPELRRLEDEELGRAMRALRRLAELTTIVERRGIRMLDLLDSRRADPRGERRFPTHRITWTGGDRSGEAFAWSDEQVLKIVEREDVQTSGPGGDGLVSPPGSTEKPLAVIRELHENREIGALCRELATYGIDVEDYGLVQEEDVTGEKLPTKYAWLAEPKRGKGAAIASADGDNDAAASPSPEDETPPEDEGEASSRRLRVIEAANVPEILDRLRELGRRGMEVKRFKGLGEMDPEQLWETTMDSSVRTLLRVTWDQGEAADELFTTLMGENVENRRSYIERHALEVKQLDV